MDKRNNGSGQRTVGKSSGVFFDWAWRLGAAGFHAGVYFAFARIGLGRGFEHGLVEIGLTMAWTIPSWLALLLGIDSGQWDRLPRELGVRGAMSGVVVGAVFMALETPRQLIAVRVVGPIAVGAAFALVAAGFGTFVRSFRNA